MTSDLIAILKKGQALVDVRLRDGRLTRVPLWKANGASSFDAWVRQQTSSVCCSGAAANDAGEGARASPPGSSRVGHW
jgi:hypothetical protein